MNALDDTVTQRRRQTRSSVFHYIYTAEDPPSKQEVAQALGLSMPTVYQNIRELQSAGLIEDAGLSQSSGGRPAMTLRAVTPARCAIGISITGFRLRLAETDLSRQEVAYKSVRHTLRVEDAAFSSYVAEQLEVFIDEHQIDRAKLLGVGIVIPGVVEPESASVFYSPTLVLRHRSLQHLVDAIPYPCHLENDGNCGGFAELFGAQEKKSIAYLSFSDGVGGAVLINGEPHFGQNGRSGEFGHMCVEWNGKLCACGKRGCLEAYCSAQRLSDDLGIPLEEFFASLKEGREPYVSIWEDYKKHLVIGVHNIRMTLDCDIVMGGPVTEFLEPYLPEIRALLAAQDPFDPDPACSYLRISRYTQYSAILGAALKFIKEFLDRI